MLKILYIGLDYYHYPLMISKEMNKLGYHVDFHSIEPRSLFYKVTRYIANTSYRKSLDNYHAEIIDRSKSKKYDFIFFITSHFFSEKNLSLLKSLHPSSEFIAYHWDSLDQYDYLDTIKFFNKIYSFDRIDCEQHGFTYLPLFASGAYQDDIESENTFDIYTISSVVRPERYVLVNKFRQFCIKNKISFYFYLKVTPITYLRLFMKGIFPKGVSFKAMNKNEMKMIVDKSSTVLDVTNHKQSGLTMRVIENTYAGKKIITTNENIMKESFYSPEQFFVLDQQSEDEITEFLKADFSRINYPELSINAWIKKVLS